MDKRGIQETAWAMRCGPADESKPKASAGVGVIQNDKAKVIKEKIRVESLQESWEAGWVEKYLVDLGWDSNSRQLTVYGKSGGSNEALATTEAIMEAIEEETNGIQSCQL